jgi:hypothetical protein
MPARVIERRKKRRKWLLHDEGGRQHRSPPAALASLWSGSAWEIQSRDYLPTHAPPPGFQFHTVSLVGYIQSIRCLSRCESTTGMYQVSVLLDIEFAREAMQFENYANQCAVW